MNIAIVVLLVIIVILLGIITFILNLSYSETIGKYVEHSKHQKLKCDRTQIGRYAILDRESIH